MHDPGMLAAEIAEHLRHRLDPAFGKGADQQTLDEGRVGEGTEEVEYRARAKLRPCRPDIAHRAMIKRREKETDLRLRSEEHTSELQSLMRIPYAVFCLKKKIKDNKNH